jgi:hypothetical protein
MVKVPAGRASFGRQLLVSRYNCIAYRTFCLPFQGALDVATPVLEAVNNRSALDEISGQTQSLPAGISSKMGTY